MSERKQVSCRVILLESGVLLAQQSDLILSLPQDNGPSSIDYQTAPDPRSSTTNLQQSQQPALASSPRHSQTPQAQLERKDSQKPLNLALSNLKERKHLSSSLTALNRTNSTPSMPGSPLKRANSANKSSTPKKLQHQGSLTRLTDYGSPDAQASSSSTKEEKDPSPPAKKNKEALVRSSSTPRRKLEEITQGIQAKGEVKVLTYSALEHLSSLYLYAECPNTCLMVGLCAWGRLSCLGKESLVSLICGTCFEIKTGSPYLVKFVEEVHSRLYSRCCKIIVLEMYQSKDNFFCHICT